MRASRRSALWFTLLVVVAACAAVLATNRPPAGHPTTAVRDRIHHATTTISAVSIRVYKAGLIERLSAPPGIVVLGGSRATRFNPAAIRAITGETAFNAAVTHASPEDAWATVSLLQRRFPQAHFRFLWIVHVDEFGGALSRDLLSDPLLAGTFPHDWVAKWSARLNLTLRRQPMMARPRNMVITDSGYTAHDSIDANAGKRPLSARIDTTIQRTLREYRAQPARLQPEACYYFRKTLALMNTRGGRVVLVLAPLQPRFYARVRRQGWALRHRLVVAYLRRLRRHYRFGLLDLSRLALAGAPGGGFYDGVHLRPSMSSRVVRATLAAFPRTL